MMPQFDLGRYGRPVTCRTPAAQAAFDQGLAWLYGYNHEAAIARFESALDIDPDCAMAHWGIACSVGPNYNRPWEVFAPADRQAALARARAAIDAARPHAPALSPVERALIAAIAARYPETPGAEIDDFAPFNDAYAAAMRRVQAEHPDDLDVAALTAEALMNRTPWQLWDLKLGTPAEGASTAEARAILEEAFARRPAAWEHPGLLHMYIHLMEMSPTPEVALRHGDALVGLVPDSGHLQHMATHIDLLCGDYQNVVSRNRLAAEVDRKYFDAEGGENFYTLYRLHNLHFECYGALFLAQPTPARAAAQELRRQLPDEVVRVYPDLFEAFVATEIEVLIRFGLWQEILEEPLPGDPELYAFTTAMVLYARTVALANLGRIDEAEAAETAFLAAVRAIPEERMLFNNSARDVLRIAEAMAAGELAFKAGRREQGLAHLRTAVARDDGLLYEEPWAWMVPARHALGALLMEAGQYDEAEAVYRADLGLDDTLARPCRHPGNVWALHGLEECLARRGEETERRHVRLALARAQARAEVPVRASCLCRGRQQAV